MRNRHTKLPFTLQNEVSPPAQKVASMDAQAHKIIPGMKGSETFKDPPAVEPFRIMGKSRGM